MAYLKDTLKSGDIRKLYLFYGNEDYLKDSCRYQVRAAVLNPGDTINVNVYDSDNLDLSSMIEQAGTLPFFAPHRLIIAKNTGFFKNKTGDALAAALPGIPAETVLVFTEEEVDRRTKLFRYAQKEGWVQDCSHLSGNELQAWILRYLARSGRQITGSAMQLFLQCIDDDMYGIVQEMEKLIAYTCGKDGIRREDVTAVCSLRPENRVFDLVDATAAGDSARAVKLYRDLLAVREKPVRILSLISRQYNLILQVKELRDQGFDRGAIVQKTGMKDFVAGKCLKQASRYTLHEVQQSLELCVDTEEKIKTGFLEEQTAVEVLIASLTVGKEKS